MARIVPIQSLSDPAVAVYAGLTGHQLKNREGLFIAESAKVISHALDAGYTPVSLLMEERQVASNASLLERCGDVEVYTAPREVLASLTGYALTRGILSAMTRPVLPTVEAVCRYARRIALLEGVVDPTNVGSIFRSAAALGMDGVLCTSTCCDPLHRRSVRVSMGAVFQLPWAILPPPWPSPGLEEIRAMGFRTVALALREDALSLEDPLPPGTDRLVILLGSEGDGLSPQTVAQCDYTLRIPMSHGVDSLNVNAAAAVAFWALR